MAAGEQPETAMMRFREALAFVNIFARLNALQTDMRTLMTMTSDLIAAVKAETDEATAAKMALQALQAEVADLQTKASAGIDPAVITQAIADLGKSTTDLASAIPLQVPVPAVPVPSPTNPVFAPTPAPVPVPEPAPAPVASTPDPVAVTVAEPVTAGSTVVAIEPADAPVAAGSSVSGPGVADGTTVSMSAPTGADSVVLSHPTTDNHEGGETLTITPPVAPAF